MIGIKAIASYLPEQQVSNVDRAEEAGKDVEFIIDKVGFTSLLRKSNEQDTSDLCVHAFEALLANNPYINKEEIDCLIVVTQNPDGFGLPHTSAIDQSGSAYENKRHPPEQRGRRDLAHFNHQNGAGGTDPVAAIHWRGGGG